ncbi:hypothetical protein LRF89_12465 [Halorhodospira sp. 9621]|uniref:hypothetical protein n=1 Tax=Halorhodospira TaxID=85108 RepID=UPI001EE96907|nr:MULTISPECIES: hypothetical protein [Halorhodospira]MCG5529086.1 hypothetical protein [Halorhodospira halophila]MCG5534248.1 hypothetical protein [Halorhodospira sp. 9621]MCG5543201.1 hypothetical protein [Halorhodospira sp. 9628]
MRMTQLKGPGYEAYVVPAPVEEMAQVLLGAFASEDPQRLRAVVGARQGQPLEAALEDWLLRQLDLEDRAVAEALFRVFVDRLQRRVEAAA